jgi:hypothetical protein
MPVISVAFKATRQSLSHRMTAQLFDLQLSRLDQLRCSSLVAATHCISGVETPQVPGH